MDNSKQHNFDMETDTGMASGHMSDMDMDTVSWYGNGHRHDLIDMDTDTT